MTEPARSEDPRRILKIGVALAISLVFGGLFVARTDLQAVLGAAVDVRVGLLVASVGVQLLGLVAAAVRLRALIRPVAELRLVDAFRAQLIGTTANNLLPLRAGELVRADAVAEITGRERAACLAAVAVERILDTGILLIVTAATTAAVAVDLSFDATLSVVGGGVVVGLGVVVALAWAEPVLVRVLTRVRGRGKLGTALDRHGRAALQGLAALRQGGLVVVAAVGTLVYWVASIGVAWCWIEAFDLGLGLPGALILLVVASFGMAIPSAPAQLGTFEAFTAYAMTVQGVETTVAASFALVCHAVLVVPLTVLGLPLVLRYAGRFRVWRSPQPAQDD